MDARHLSFEQRHTIARRFITRLFDPQERERAVRAIVADGWPEPMAREGLALHERTWQLAGLVQALERELQVVGGLQALEGATPHARAVAPRHVIHVWPALPGAGLTPVLLGWLLGARQTIRPSSRGMYFAMHLHDVFRECAAGQLAHTPIAMEFDAIKPDWRDADALIVSGQDDTVAALHEFLGRPRHRARPTLIGYGHRVSFAVIVDDGSNQPLDDADRLARDVVMWHQTGCFSARAVVFCGSPQRATLMAEALGDAIAREEARLGAQTLDAGALAKRAQARGVAEFMGQLHGAGLGWVQPTRTPWRGEQVSAHTVTLHTIPSLEALDTALSIPSHQLQGVALGTYRGQTERLAWADALALRGATRICRPGTLQSPPPGWMHDGWPNLLDWLRVCTIDD